MRLALGSAGVQQQVQRGLLRVGRSVEGSKQRRRGKPGPLLQWPVEFQGLVGSGIEAVLFGAVQVLVVELTVVGLVVGCSGVLVAAAAVVVLVVVLAQGAQNQAESAAPPTLLLNSQSVCASLRVGCLVSAMEIPLVQPSRSPSPRCAMTECVSPFPPQPFYQSLVPPLCNGCHPVQGVLGQRRSLLNNKHDDKSASTGELKRRTATTRAASSLSSRGDQHPRFFYLLSSNTDDRGQD